MLFEVFQTEKNELKRNS